MSDGWYKCDRCGDFERGPIKRGGRALTPDFSEDAYRRIKYGHRTGEDNSGSITRSVDLCEACRKALTAWIKAGGGPDE